MIATSIEIDRAAVASLDDILRQLEKESPRRLAAGVRRAAIYICQSLRANTKVAKKNIRSYPSEYVANLSTIWPPYIHSNSAHHRLLRRWQLARKLGTPAESVHHYYVYTDRHRVKGKMVGGSIAREKAELLRLHGKISRYGLAKKSWGWVMKGLYDGGAGDLSWKKTRGERRDPRKYVEGLFMQSMETKVSRAEIHNKLDYILFALPPGKLEEAIGAAVRKLEHNTRDHIEKVTR